MKYNPALDGLRAVAIILVLACHTAGFALPGGWIGVDVFFVLSGYLITSILMRELMESGRIDMGRFYARRALRLLPALAILALFQLVRSRFSPNGGEIREATLVGVIYLENWNSVFMWWPPDLMGHTWSLAVEEQFYLVWPVLLILVAHRKPLAWICGAAVAMVAARIICARLGYAETTLQNSMGLRPVGLLVGCALALVQWKAPTWSASVALAGIVVLAVFVNRYPALYLVAPFAVSLATAVVIAGAKSGLLTWQPLRYIGRISYGIYLYHWPLFILGEKLKPPGAGHWYALALIALIVGAAALSYELVEKPILRMKDRIGQKHPAAIGAVA